MTLGPAREGHRTRRARGERRPHRARPVRVPNTTEAVVEVVYGGICGSDLHYWRHGAAGLSILKEPMLLGHEIVGVVRQGASDGSGPTPGTPVAVHPARPGPGDGTQRYPADRPNLSPGCAYLGSAAHRPHTQGGFAHYVTLGAHMLRPLPAGLALRTAAVAEPASVAWHAVGRAGDVRGRSALVIGAGPIGALVVAVLRRAGAAEITVVDLHEAPLERARALGATRTLLAADRTALAGGAARRHRRVLRQRPRPHRRHHEHRPRWPGGHARAAATRRAARADGHRDRTRARAHRVLPVQRRDRRRAAAPWPTGPSTWTRWSPTSTPSRTPSPRCTPPPTPSGPARSC